VARTGGRRAAHARPAAAIAARVRGGGFARAARAP